MPPVAVADLAGRRFAPSLLRRAAAARSTSRRAAAAAALLATVLLGGALLAGAFLAAAPVATAQPAREAFFTAIARDDDGDAMVYLLRGASAATRNRDGTPALVYAAAERAFRVVRTFLAIPGTEVDMTNPANETALMYAALHGNLEIARLLLEKGAQVNRTGWTPLHYAATGGSEAMVDLLLEHHAYIDAESPNRSTPLMLAVRQKREPVARRLVDAGADPTVRNQAGLSAADYAARSDNEPLAQWLGVKATEFTARYKAAGTVRR
jgi:ankyrin repeat protein